MSETEADPRLALERRDGEDPGAGPEALSRTAAVRGRVMIGRLLGHVLLWVQWHTSQPESPTAATEASVQVFRSRSLNESAHKLGR